MSKILFSTLLILSSLSLFAHDEVFVRQSDFGKAQTFASRYNDGDVLVTINKASVVELGNGDLRGTIEYTVTNNLKSDIDRFELDFELENADRREIMDIKADNRDHRRISAGSTEKFSVTRTVREKRSRPAVAVDTVKVELDDVYLVNDRREVKF